MKMLPVIPVETLANQIRAAAPTGNRNPGIVPPWLQKPDRNPGIVPPWLQDRPVGPVEPVPDDVPRIFAAQPTVYDPQPVEIDPDMPRIMGR